MDTALQRLLDELTHMEARLTGVLAGRCGEQSARARTPSSDDGSTPSYLAPTSEAVDKLRLDLNPCCVYRDSIQHHRVEDPSAEEDLQPQAEVESFESESAPPPVVYDRYDEPNHDEIAEVLARVQRGDFVGHSPRRLYHHQQVAYQVFDDGFLRRRQRRLR